MRIEQVGDDVLIWIKAVPGATRDEISGTVGERLKVRISAPPEGGKANKAICRVIVDSLGVKPRQVSVDAGATNPEKIVRITSVALRDVRARLEEAAH